MGLLTDTYSDILKKLQGVNLRDENDFSGMDSDFNDGSGFKASELILLTSPLITPKSVAGYESILTSAS